jgi:hypothetical protein
VLDGATVEAGALLRLNHLRDDIDAQNRADKELFTNVYSARVLIGWTWRLSDRWFVATVPRVSQPVAPVERAPPTVRDGEHTEAGRQLDEVDREREALHEDTLDAAPWSRRSRPKNSIRSSGPLLPVPSRRLVQLGASFTGKPDRLLIASERHATRRVPFSRRRRPISFAAEADERSNVGTAGIEIYRDANKTERLLHIQEIGVPGDPIVSAMIWCPRAERGQRATAIISVPLLGALSTEPWRYRRRRDRGILPSWPRPLPPRLSPKRLP